jgi:hypothetical protein
MTTITIGYPSQTDNITIQPNITQVINVNAYSDTAESFVVIPSNNVSYSLSFPNVEFINTGNTGGGTLAETFEYYSKNLKSVNNTIVYANTGFATNVVYSDGSVKSLYYNGNNFVIRVNITASGFAGNKYISYINNTVSTINYGT